MFLLYLFGLVSHLTLEPLELGLCYESLEGVLDLWEFIVELVFVVDASVFFDRIWRLSSFLSIIFLRTFLLWGLRLFFLGFGLGSMVEKADLDDFELFFKLFWIFSHLVLHSFLFIFYLNDSSMMFSISFSQFFNQKFKFFIAKI